MERCLVLPTIAVAILLMVCTLTEAQAQSVTSFVSQVEVADEVVTFKTNEGNYVDFTMTVAGPDDFWYEQTFSGKETPSLRVKTAKGRTLSDGSYLIEMSARPKISDKQRAALDKARHDGDRYAMRKLMEEIGLHPEAMVYRASLGVAKGAFVNPEADEPEEKTGAVKGSDTHFGAADTQDSTPQIQSVQLTGRRWDAAYLPNTPDATGTAVQPAALAADASEVAPPFLQGSPDPAAAWYEASFENTTPDGTSLTYQGFLRPVATDAEGKLFEVYLRKVDAAVAGPWVQGFFRADEAGFRAANHAQTSQPFDYLTDESPEATEPAGDGATSIHFIGVVGNNSIDGSLCVGFDCVAEEAFGFDTIRMKENNLRLDYQDTSNTASFPPNDWRVVINDSANGGANHYSIEDRSAGRFVFRVFAGARSNALTVDSQGDVGLGTTTPALDIDIKTGNTPSIRLQQDGTSGFTPQSWDLAGNEAGFFVRDATGGSTLPLRIRIGAPSSAIDIKGGSGTTEGDVGLGTASPDADLHIRNTPATDNAEIILEANSHEWQFRTIASSGDFTYRDNDAGTAPFKIANGAASNLMQIGNVTGCGVGCAAGQLTIDGDILATGTITPDYVFEPDYKLESIEEHAAYMWQNKHLPTVGGAVVIGGKHRINLGDRAQATLEELEKAHIYIEQLHKRALEQQQTIEQQQQTIEAVLARLAALEKADDTDQE